MKVTEGLLWQRISCKLQKRKKQRQREKEWEENDILLLCAWESHSEDMSAFFYAFLSYCLSSSDSILSLCVCARDFFISICFYLTYISKAFCSPIPKFLSSFTCHHYRLTHAHAHIPMCTWTMCAHLIHSIYWADKGQVLNYKWFFYEF